MIDYFALLGIERRADLREEELQERYHDLTRKVHPDQARDAEERERFVRAATEYNQAWDTLRRPVTRLRHLLELTVPGESREVALDAGLMDLFGRTGALLREADVLLDKRRATASPLGKALLSDGMLAMQKRLQDLLREVTRELDARLRHLDELDVDQVDALRKMHGELSFLEKWRAQLQQRILAIMADT